MAKEIYQQHMQNRIQDLSFAIDMLHRRMDETANDRTKVDLSARLSALERRRDRMEQKLKALESEPDTAWTNLKAQLAEEWYDLVRDFEGRVENLR